MMASFAIVRHLLAIKLLTVEVRVLFHVLGDLGLRLGSRVSVGLSVRDSSLTVHAFWFTEWGFKI